VKRTFLFHDHGSPHEKAILEACQSGFKVLGVRIRIVDARAWDGSVAEQGVVMVGTKPRNRDLMTAYRAAGVRVVFFDKGYVRAKQGGDARREFYRASVDALHPWRYMNLRQHPARRWVALGYELGDWRRGNAVLLDGASTKYCDWWRLGDPTTWARDLVQRIRDATDRPIIYRPRPALGNRLPPIAGTTYSGPGDSLYRELALAHCVVTWGGNISFDAVLDGVPLVVLGESVAQELAATDLGRIDGLKSYRTEARLRWCHDLAWCQWTLREIAEGQAFRHLADEGVLP
jgi:hypothetical protein